MSQQSKNNSTKGFLPCFSKYDEERYPIANLYSNSVFVRKVKELILELFESQNPVRLQKYMAKKITPDSNESKRLISQINTVFPLVRIDYGDCSLRVIYSYQNNPTRIVYFHAIDTKHETYNGKIKR